MADEEEYQPPVSALRSYAELVRLPNVFTAIADVMMGYLVAMTSLQPVPPLLMLVATSACLYLAGMVYNDIFDRIIDARERPDRPIPSGRVSLGNARFLGATLLCIALAIAGQVSWRLESPKPFSMAIGIAVLMLLYNKWLKHTPIGPLAMGGCRTLNVLLGMSGSTSAIAPLEWLIAAGLGVYVVGITVFARREVETSSRGWLVSGLLVMLAGMGLIASVPMLIEDWRLGGLDRRWPWFWALLTAHIVWRCGQAIANPTPGRVKVAVTNCIMSIIVIDAAASLATAGVPYFSLLILMLIVPATVLGRWIYST